MNSVLSTEMTTRNTDEMCIDESPNCTHETTKKAKKIGGKCALCRKRVWKFWKARKCVECNSAVHRSCIAARENEKARNLTAEPTAATEAAAKTVAPVQMTDAVAFPTGRLTRGQKDEPMYVTPTPWLLANLTTVLIDCRRRPEPVAVVVNCGLDLSVDMFVGLFDLLPAENRGTTARHQYASVSARGTGPMKTETASPPRHRQCSVERDAETRREAGDTGRTTRLSDEAPVERVGRETD